MQTTVTIKLVRDDNVEFVIDGDDWGVLSIDGAEAPTYEVFSEKAAVGDGNIITGKRVGARELQIRACAKKPNLNDLLRSQALSFFNPKRTYRVYLFYMARSYWIDGILSAFDCANQNVFAPQEFTALFLCPEPYWNSLDGFGKDIASETARWGFPYLDHPNRGVLVSTYNFARTVLLNYDGDVPAPFTAELQADDTVVNPKIIKDGYFVRILDTLQNGDLVQIDFKRSTITKNGENILSKTDRSSNFTNMQMNPGANQISYEADSGDNNLHVVLRYYKKYLGV